MSAEGTPCARFDAIVIGGSVGGLVAAATLAKGGARVTVLEARNVLGGRAETAALAEGFLAPPMDDTLYAADPGAVRELQLYRHGLKFVERDMPLVALRPGGRHIVLPRDIYGGRAAIALHAPADADAYVRFRRETFAFARRLRPLWNGDGTGPAVDGESSALAQAVRRLRLSDRYAAQLEGLSRTSAAAYLDRWFETDAVKAVLAGGAILDGQSPHEAGTALTLIWRYAQESCGLQGAVSQPLGGPGSFAAALSSAGAEAGVTFRTGARVASLLVEGGRAGGVTLDTGEMVRAPCVLSSLDARQTLLDLAPAVAVGFGLAASLPEAQRLGRAKILLALNAPPPFAGLTSRALRGRLIIAERPESAAEAKGAALTGRLPAELVFEATVPSIADPALTPEGSHVLSLVVPYVPVTLENGWEEGRAALRDRAIAALENFAPGLRDRIVTAEVLTPGDIAHRYGGEAGEIPAPLTRLLAPCEARVRSALAGVYLCGNAAEPGGAISGRAGRVAAKLILSELRPSRGEPS